jgi:hypothetical protein
VSWGVKENDDKKEIHVLPCDQNGIILNPHITDMLCGCNPSVEKTSNGIFIIIHNEVH